MKIDTLPLSYRGKTILAYRCGQGSDVILLLHGAGLDNAKLSFEGLMERLGKRARVYALDLPGYGGSDPLGPLPEEGLYPYYHHCVEAAVDQLRLRRFALVGSSMGGAIAIRYALAHPEQVCGLVPIGSWGLSEKAPSHSLVYWLSQRQGWLEKNFRRLSQSPGLLRLLLQSVLLGRKTAITPELLQELQNLAGEEKAVEAFAAFVKSSLSPRGCIPAFGEELAKLRMPVLLIHGKRDPLVPRANAQRAQRIMGNSRLHVLPSCRHWCVREQPEPIVQAIWAFLKRDCLFSYSNQLPQGQPALGLEVESPSPETAQLRTALRQRVEKQRLSALGQKIQRKNRPRRGRPSPLSQRRNLGRRAK